MKAFFDKQLQIACRTKGIEMTQENRPAVERVLKTNMKKWSKMWIKLGN